MAKINYIIPCWSGPRRTKNEETVRNSTYFLKKHFAMLGALEHNLSQITVLVPDNPHEPQEYTNFISSIPSEFLHSKVVVIRRPNIGLSYGCWSHAYGLYHQDFDYYILTEDDYKFSLDNFDSIMLEYLAEVEKVNRQKIGFLCGLVRPRNGFAPHASVAVGLASSQALEAVWRKYGMLPHAPDSAYYHAEKFGQVGFSHAILNCGWGLFDVRKKYKVGFRNTDTSIEWFGEGDTLYEPI